ncbi:tyrosine-type recombinase/integrase [Flavivirga aquatica]|uniref:tyrosine-type recombinase/integrase n=2 Tax=Flavivirga aquatica TaxID=1849968 RepID=UPI0009F6649B|nr:site-specific integrase [Flavivirga aquatica]
MNTYEHYLEKNGYNDKSIRTYQRSVTRFNDWCESYGTHAETIDYKTFLQYIAYLRASQLKPRTLQTYIGNLKIYFNYLTEENHREKNDIKDLNIKGVKRHIIHNILEFEELEDLYYSYPINKGKEIARKRNKIIIGLLVYQGLNTRDLQLLEVENIQLYKGKITVPGTRKSNTRDIELKPFQLMEFMEYINEVRPRILKETNKVTEQLLLPIGRSYKLHNTIHKLAKELKEINNSFTDVKQIRTSVIIHWLKQNGLRKAQYLTGHKYISSTERYQQDDLESLHETINNFHPLR